MMSGLEATLAEYDLAVSRTGDGALRVYHPDFNQVILEGDEESCSLLVAVLVSERLRIASELQSDAAAGRLSGFDGDLDAVCDSNVYLAGGRSDGRYDDEKFGWSDIRASKHARFLLSFGVIGKGVEQVDAGDLPASTAFTGFLNGVNAAVHKWLGEGHLQRFMPSSPSMR